MNHPNVRTHICSCSQDDTTPPKASRKQEQDTHVEDSSDADHGKTTETEGEDVVIEEEYTEGGSEEDGQFEDDETEERVSGDGEVNADVR